MNKSDAEKINQIAAMCMADMVSDYTGLFHIAGRVRHAFGPRPNEEVKRLSIEVVRRILERGLRPGDYLRSGMKYWAEGPEQVIDRISREWIPSRGDPTLGEPICWFGIP